MQSHEQEKRDRESWEQRIRNFTAGSYLYKSAYVSSWPSYSISVIFQVKRSGWFFFFLCTIKAASFLVLAPLYLQTPRDPRGRGLGARSKSYWVFMPSYPTSHYIAHHLAPSLPGKADFPGCSPCCQKGLVCLEPISSLYLVPSPSPGSAAGPYQTPLTQRVDKARGAMVEPCCMKPPTGNQRLLPKEYWLTSRLHRPWVQGCGLYHS